MALTTKSLTTEKIPSKEKSVYYRAVFFTLLRRFFNIIPPFSSTLLKRFPNTSFTFYTNAPSTPLSHLIQPRYSDAPQTFPSHPARHAPLTFRRHILHILHKHSLNVSRVLLSHPAQQASPAFLQRLSCPDAPRVLNAPVILLSRLIVQQNAPPALLSRSSAPLTPLPRSRDLSLTALRSAGTSSVPSRFQNTSAATRRLSHVSETSL